LYSTPTCCFVRHPESDYVLEEEWLYEAITETYIPLQSIWRIKARRRRLQNEHDTALGVDVTRSLLQERYNDHLAKLELTQLEIEHMHNGHVRYLAEHYATEFKICAWTWERYNGDLVTAFKKFQDGNNSKSSPAAQLTATCR